MVISNILKLEVKDGITSLTNKFDENKCKLVHGGPIMEINVVMFFLIMLLMKKLKQIMKRLVYGFLGVKIVLEQI